MTLSTLTALARILKWMTPAMAASITGRASIYPNINVCRQLNVRQGESA